MSDPPVPDALLSIPVDSARSPGHAAVIVEPIPGVCPSGADATVWWTTVLAVFAHCYTGETEVTLVGDGAGDGLVAAHRVAVSSDDTVGTIAGRVAGTLVCSATVPRSALLAATTAGAASGVTASVARGSPDDRAAEGGLVTDLAVVPRGDGSTADLVASSALWTPETVTRMARHLGRIAGAAADKDAVGGRIDLLDPAERARMVVAWNATDTAWPAGGYLDLLRERVRRDPDRPALVGGGRTVTFGELEEASDRIAWRLRELGARPGERVGLLAPRGVGFVIAAVGILKTGAAVVPLDPVNPAARIARMVDDCAPLAVLAPETMADRVPAGPPVLPVEPPAGDAPAARFPVEVTDDTVSHLIYTSGSTGEPKAVLERHGALVNLVHWTGRAYRVRPGDRASWLSTPGFAVQLMEWMPYLPLGATLHVGDLEDRTPAQVRDWLVAQEVTHTMLVAALAERVWALSWPPGSKLRIMVTTAERVHSWPPPDTAFTVVMTYGSTETTNVLTCLDLGAGLDLTARATPAAVRAARPVPVGRPIANQRVYILDPAGRPVPVGVVGRLHVAGAGVALGYYRRPELTAARFRTNPLPEERSPVMYDTGDLARYRADGAVELLGRHDSQVKIRGFRVELGEVETAVAAVPGVAEAAVTVRDGDSGDRQLVAYVATAGGGPPQPGELRAHLAGRLPHYMVPSQIVGLPKLPRLPNGKVDLRALPAQSAEPVSDPPGGATGPRDEIEAGLLQEWHRLFGGAGRIGIHDNFFELGGHSLLAFRLIDDVRARFQVELSLPDLYRCPTVAMLAERVAAGRDHLLTDFGGLPPLTADPGRRYEPFPLTDSQQALWIGRGDAVALGNVGCHGYFEWDGDIDPERFTGAWQALVGRHDALRTVISPAGTQRVLAAPPDYRIPVLDLRAVGPDEARRRLDELRSHLSHQVMVDDQWPLFDVRVSLLPDGFSPGRRTRLHLSLDFLITDAWSYFQILIPDLVHFYEHPDRPLPELELTFRDYVTGVRERLPDSDQYRRSELYWRDRLATLPPAPRLPARPADQPPLPVRFDRCTHHIDLATWERLLARAGETGVTGSVLLATAFADVLRAWSGQPRFTINFPLFNRLPLHRDVDRIIGDTTTTLLLAVEKSDGTFTDRAVALQEQLWADLEHRYFSGVQVLRELTRLRGTMVPAMPVVMTSLVGHPPRRHASPLGDQIYAISQTPQVELDFQVYETAGKIQINWDYLPALFPDGLIEAIFADFRGLLDRLDGDAEVWHAASPAGGPGTGVPPPAVAAGAGGTGPPRAAPHRPREVGEAWERYWSGIRRTGADGDVLWDPGSQDEIDWCVNEAVSRLDRSLPIVDVGCGNGRFTRALAAHFPGAIGVDVAMSAVRAAEQESGGAARVSFRELDITRPAEAGLLGEEIGDANVFVRGVLHVLDDPARAAAADSLAELVGRRGSVMLLEPSYEEGAFGYVGHVGGARGRVPELVGPLERAGVGASSRFADREVERFFAPGAGWRRVVSGPATLRVLDPEGPGAVSVPGFYAVLARSG
jgi:amino acid adenylation domain-containing protein